MDGKFSLSFSLLYPLSLSLTPCLSASQTKVIKKEKENSVTSNGAQLTLWASDECVKETASLTW